MATSTPLSAANATFALALFKKLSEDDKKANVFYSPFSISSALAMVMLGARGNTATQMSEALRFTKTEQPTEPGLEQVQMMQQVTQKPQIPQCLKPQSSQDDVHAKFAKLLSKLNKADAPYTLSVANRLYGEQSYQFVKDFLAETGKHYSAELESVDFKNKAEAARVNINSWVEKQTQDKIKDLLAQGVVDNMTKLVLVNAIYFKGNWAKQFKEEVTEDAQFRINKNDAKLVKMMRQTSEFRVNNVPEVNCKILEMPYRGNDLSMLIFLPNEIEDDTTGLEKLEKALTYEKFMEWTEKMHEFKVEVSLPRFKMEEKYDLNDVLISMGMVDAFNPAMSDFSGMSTTNDLSLTKVVHKAFVEVNEEGTEAAAATAPAYILELPYKGNDLSMLIFLPNEIEDDTTGLEKLEKALTYEKFNEWTSPDMMIKDEVNVSLPRFKMEEKYDLNDVLISMGMVDAFNVGMSDFSGMSPANDLFLSKVVHKAFVEVNEEGTEAAAATGAIVSERSARITETFIADHPFLFFIRHNDSKSILFAGRYCSPE